MSGVRQIKVGEEDDGQRLDRWFKKHLPQMPFSLLQKLVRKGQIRVDGKRVETGARLAAGQEIRIPPFSGGRKDDEWFRPMPDDAGYVRSMIIYDDGDIIALNKPFGVASQGGMRVARHIDGLLAHLEDEEGRRPKLIHRLDRDTSGVLLLARSRETAARLGKLFGGREIVKTYWAITIPPPERNEGTIDLPVAKGTGNQKDMMVIDPADGKRSITDFRVIERAGAKAAFVAFRPRTGRTHQIRVHAAASGFPILGDEKYMSELKGEGDESSQYWESVNCARRLHLHARRLVLPHPDGRQILDFNAPLPEDLRQGWTELGFSVNLEGDQFS